MVRLLGGVKLTFPFLARPAAFDRNKPPAVVLSFLLPTNPALNTELTDYLLKYERFCYSYMTVALRKKQELIVINVSLVVLQQILPLTLSTKAPWGESGTPLHTVIGLGYPGSMVLVSSL